MQNRQSYIDALNAGRERKTYSAYDQLDDTLSRLEERLDSLSRRSARMPARDSESASQGNTREEIARRLERLAAPKSDRVVPAARQRADLPAEPKHQDASTDGHQEGGIEAVARIAEKLNQLREELKGDMSDTLAREFEVMRRDIEKAYTAAANGRNDDDLSEELEQIATSVKLLAERQGRDGIEEIGADVTTIKKGLAVLAREDTLRSHEDRWNELSERFQRIENALASDSGGNSGELKEIGALVQQVASTVENLPATLSSDALDGRVKDLAEMIETFAGQAQSASRKSFGQLEQRLDEISRALASAPAAAKIDNEPLDRIEARIATLSDQLETFSKGQDNSEIGQRIATLSAHIEKFAAANTSSEQIVEILNERLSAIAEKIEAIPNGDSLLSVVGEKIDNLAGQIAASEAQTPDNNMLERMQGRLDEIVSRLDQPLAAPAATDNEMLQNLESHLKEISAHLARSANAPAAEIGPRLESIEASIASTRENLEAQLTELTSHLSANPDDAGYPRDLLPRLASLEASLETAREKLGAQLAEVGSYLSTQPEDSPFMAELPERLARIESSLERTHETVLDVARLAAEEAIKSVPGDVRDDALFSELTMDLKDLEQLTRKSEERNARTFEAIHDTLLKIVEHLSELETGTYSPSDATPDYSEINETPSLDDGIGEPLMENAETASADEAAGAVPQDVEIDEEQSKLSPAEAAAAAAMAALENRRGPVPDGKSEKSRKSMFAGLSRAFSSSKSEAPSKEVSNEDDYVILDDEPAAAASPEKAPALDDSPLEPGSGAPDLSAIMNRVRDQNQSAQATGKASAAQSDFIAAARRAAQAAAAEAEVQKRKSDPRAENSGKFSIGNLVGGNRKALMLGVAAILVLAGTYQFGTTFFKGGDAAVKNMTAAAEQSSAPADQGKQLAANSAKGDQSDAAPKANIGAKVQSALTENPPAGSSETAVIAENSTVSKPAGTDNTSTAATRVELPAPTMTLPPFSTVASSPATMAPEQKTASVSQGSGSQAQPKSGPAAMPQVVSLPEAIGPVALRTAAEKGDPKAMFEVATRYSEGLGIPADPAKAAEWFKQAATLGLAVAQYRYGGLLEKGTGVKRDLNAAVDWYQKAAQQGNASAMHNLAVLFAMGAVGPVDNETAVRWFKKAADFGITDSQYNLAIMAAKGAGMPRDLEESYKWFAIAAKSGDKDASQKRDEVAKALQPGQLAKARATVELWKAKTPDPEANSVQIPDAWIGKPAETASVDMHKAIRNIQILLANHGYNPGSPDGMMGEKTKRAIIAYQKDNGLAATGEIDETLVRKLLGKE